MRGRHWQNPCVLLYYFSSRFFRFLWFSSSFPLCSFQYFCNTQCFLLCVNVSISAPVLSTLTCSWMFPCQTYSLSVCICVLTFLFICLLYRDFKSKIFFFASCNHCVFTVHVTLNFLNLECSLWFPLNSVFFRLQCHYLWFPHHLLPGVSQCSYFL